MESKEKSNGKLFLVSETYNKTRKKLIKIIGQINAVSNPEGHGRDDFNVGVLVASESLVRRISATQSRAVRALAENAKKVFLDMRALFRKYQQNIEIVDPQLRNNPDLVQALVKFESTWEKATIYFSNPKKCNQFLHFSERLEAIMEKHEGFREQIETRDAEIFVSIPCFLVLMALDQEDRKLCQSFCPDMFKDGTDTNLKFQELKAHFEGRNIEEDFELYNILEKTILDLKLNPGE